jgi:hypothetical protein
MGCSGGGKNSGKGNNGAKSKGKGKGDGAKTAVSGDGKNQQGKLMGADACLKKSAEFDKKLEKLTAGTKPKKGVWACTECGYEANYEKKPCCHSCGEPRAGAPPKAVTAKVEAAKEPKAESMGMSLRRPPRS